MRAVLTIAAKDLRQRIRDRSAFIIAFLVPFGLAAIISLTLGNVDEESDFTATYAVVDLDRGDLSLAFADVLGQLEFAKLREVGTVAEAEGMAEDGEVDAAFVIPESFSEGAARAEGGEIRVIQDPNQSIGPLIARSLAQSFASEVNAVQVSVGTATAGGTHPGPDEMTALVERARQTAATAVVQQDTTESRLFSSTTFYAAGMAVFFVFFAVEFGVRSLLEERQNGTLARLLVAPMRPVWIVAGKSLAAFAVGVVSMSSLVVASTFLLGAEWGNALGVVLLIIAGVLSAMGLTSLLATVARTPEQAGSYTSAAAVTLGLLGGTFFPVSQGPALLANISLVAPQAWLMRGFQDLASGAGLGELVVPLLAILAFTVVTGGVALARAGRLVPR